MDFGLNEQQEMLKKTARELLVKECPASLVREMTKDKKGYPLELYQKMTELGWPGLIFPEKYSGLGGSFIDLAVLLEEMGRVALPGPLFANIQAGMAILEMGNEQQKEKLLPQIAAGKVNAALAYLEPDLSYDLTGIQTAVTKRDGNLIVNGTKLFMPDANVADYIIFTAKTARSRRNKIGAYLIPVSPGLIIKPMENISGEKRYEVTFKDVSIAGNSMLSADAEAGLNRVLQKAAIGSCAMMIGGAGAALESAVEHSKQRVQFGRPIGSFQAVQHHCSNMLTDLDCSKFLCYRAAWMLSTGTECTKEVSMAKALVSDAFARIISLAHQVNGGVGLMDDHLMSLFSKRAIGLEYGFGDADYHREIVAQKIGL